MKKAFLIVSTSADDATTQLNAFFAGTSSAGAITNFYAITSYVKDGLFHHTLIYN